MLFHYTNASGLLGIIESNTLFATHYRFLNDESEFELYKTYLLNLFENEIRKNIEIKKNSGQYKIMLDNINYEKNIDELVSSVRGVFWNTFEEGSKFYLTSFCDHTGDDFALANGILSQWRAYGGEAGVALGINYDELMAMVKSEYDKFRYTAHQHRAVVYTDTTPSIEFPELSEMARQIVNLSLGETVESTVSFEPAFKHIVENAPFFKNRGFEEEREFRIALGHWSKASKIRPEDQRLPKQVDFRIRSSTIIPYIKLFSDINGNIPFTRIIVGPSKDQKKVTESIEFFLATKGIKIEVVESTIPYRSI